MKIKRCNITNNNIKSMDQPSREELLGDAISSILWENNIKIEPVLFLLKKIVLQTDLDAARTH